MQDEIIIKTADIFFAGGNYDRIHLVEAGKTTGDLSGLDSYWLIKVRKGTDTHKAMDEAVGVTFFAERQRSDTSGGRTMKPKKSRVRSLSVALWMGILDYFERVEDSGCILFPPRTEKKHTDQGADKKSDRRRTAPHG